MPNDNRRNDFVNAKDSSVCNGLCLRLICKCNLRLFQYLTWFGVLLAQWCGHEWQPKALEKRSIHVSRNRLVSIRFRIGLYMPWKWSFTCFEWSFDSNWTLFGLKWSSHALTLASHALELPKDSFYISRVLEMPKNESYMPLVSLHMPKNESFMYRVSLHMALMELHMLLMKLHRPSMKLHMPSTKPT